MRLTLGYGYDSRLDIEVEGAQLIADCTAEVESLQNPARVLHQALREPLNYPPLSLAVTPDDRVVLAVDAGVPVLDQLIPPIVMTLVEAGVQPGHITLLFTGEDAARQVVDPRSLLPEEIQNSVLIVLHQPDVKADLSYLASTAGGQRIYLNRLLTDADVVIPIGCARYDALLGYQGTHSGLYPTFSDADTQLRYRMAEVDLFGSSEEPTLREEVDEVGWLLGVQFTVQVVPGPHGGILQVLAGEPRAVLEEAKELLGQRWAFQLPQTAHLVIASVEGPPSQQTWRQIGRALASATQVVEDGGAILLCCDLGISEGDKPGPAVQWMADADELQDVLPAIQKNVPLDAVPAIHLARALTRAKVYLLSKLDDALVEDLHVVPIQEESEIAHLIEQHTSCVLVGNAQHAWLAAASQSA